MPHAEKDAIRQEAKVRRAALEPRQRDTFSGVIADRVIDALKERPPGRLGVFLPIRDEVDTSIIVDWARDFGLPLALPDVLDRASMVFRAFDSDTELVDGAMGTTVPAPETRVVRPDTLLVPLLAFDRRGARLGYGRGYYDRAIAESVAAGLRPRLLGLAFGVQEFDALEVEPHDELLDFVATESAWIVCGQTREME